MPPVRVTRVRMRGFVDAQRPFENVDGRDEHEMESAHLAQHRDQTLDRGEIAVGIAVRFPLLGADTGADDQIEAAAAQLLDVRRVHQRVERHRSAQVRADEAGVADERAAHGSNLPRQAAARACSTVAPPRKPRIFDGSAPDGYSRRTGTSTTLNPSRAARIDK